MHPLRHDFGSFAVIAPVLRQSPEAGSYSAAAAQYFSASPSLAYRFLGQSIRERVGRKSGHPGRSDSGQTEKNALRANVFRVAPESGHYPMQTATCLKRAKGLNRSRGRALRRVACPCQDGTMGASSLTMRGQKHVPKTDDRSA